jgi:hypothetical protein
VIELADDHIAKQPAGDRGHVHVGQTGLPVLERVEQHRLVLASSSSSHWLSLRQKNTNRQRKLIPGSWFLPRNNL